MNMIRRLKDWSNTFEYFSDSYLLFNKMKSAYYLLK